MLDMNVWNRAEIILDTNALLNLFRVSPDTSAERLELLERLSNQIWLPRQFFDEYRNHLPEVLNGIGSIYRKRRGNLQSYRDKTEKVLLQFNGMGKLTIAQHIPRLYELFEDIFADITVLKKEHVSTVFEEDIKNRIERFIAGKVGDPLPDSRLAEIPAIWQWRLERDIPPGLKDKHKPEPGRYGDLIGWLQIIDHADDTGRPVILVTDDLKTDDWFRLENGKLAGPHPKLIQELYDKAGVTFHSFTSEQFIFFARHYLRAQELATVAGPYFRDAALTFLPDVGKLFRFQNISTLAAKVNFVGASRQSLVDSVSGINRLLFTQSCFHESFSAFNDLLDSSAINRLLDTQLRFHESFSAFNDLLDSSAINRLLDTQLRFHESFSALNDLLDSSAINRLLDTQLRFHESFSALNDLLDSSAINRLLDTQSRFHESFSAFNDLPDSSAINRLLDTQLRFHESFSAFNALPDSSVINRLLDTQSRFHESFSAFNALPDSSVINRLLDTQSRFHESISAIHTLSDISRERLLPIEAIRGVEGGLLSSSIDVANRTLATSRANILRSSPAIAPDLLTRMNIVPDMSMKALNEQFRTASDAMINPIL